MRDRARCAATQALCCGHSRAKSTTTRRASLGRNGLWRGMLGADASGQPGGMLYPAPGLVGLLVAIATHAAIVEGSRKAQRSEQEKAADAVLEPYRPLLAGWSARDLADAAAPQLQPQRPAVRVVAAGGAAAADEWLVDMTPVFVLAQDHSTLVFDGVLLLQPPGAAPAAAAVPVAVRVLSSPLPAALAIDAPDRQPLPGTAQQHWSADSGRALKQTAAALAAHAVDAALSQATATAVDMPFRTHRYLVGDEERMERSQLLARNCGRVLLRTLRGGLLSAPVRPAGDAPCAPSFELVASRPPPA